VGSYAKATRAPRHLVKVKCGPFTKKISIFIYLTIVDVGYKLTLDDMAQCYNQQLALLLNRGSYIRRDVACWIPACIIVV
jgi:hypothetical protein